MADLFGNKAEIIRTLGFYQPFCSLMLHGKIETRWVREFKKPPFIKGKYLFYSTKKCCDSITLIEWCGTGVASTIDWLLMRDQTRALNGYAIGIGELVNIRLMSPDDEGKTFVKYVGRQLRPDKDGKKHHWYLQWCLEFENVQAIEPFKFDFGKQGVGILPESERNKIKILSTTGTPV
jgi:hypothetical protein